VRTFYSKRYALGICAVVVLAGCGGSQSQIGAPGAVPPGYQTQRDFIDAKGTIKVLHSFTGTPDGAQPRSGVVTFSRKELPPGPQVVGAAFMGGDANNDGAVYGLTPGTKGSWTESVLYTFKGVNDSDGSGPVGLYKEVDAATPKVFVTTVAGGTYGLGAVVELTPAGSGSWAETVVHSFGPSDGQSPYAAVIADKAGNLYGTTSAGGLQGAGTVYRMQPKGSSYSETVLYSFQSGTDGDRPYADLIIDTAGALYGATMDGGSNGLGTVFKLTPSGSGYKESVIYSFQGPPNDGQYPVGGLAAAGGLTLAAGGKVIGMASSGGSQGYGVAYKLTPTGSTYSESILWNFGAVTGDGTDPRGDVVVNTKGAIYGTTVSGGSGGSSGLGTLFTLTPSGSTYKERLYSFTGANGANPYAGPTVDNMGHLYVTTTAGGTNNVGTVVRCTLGTRVQHICE
jgi:uncharacterized repeat protein (TIGR03803 family)